ncbi:GTP cyclohydrolase II [Schizosaccharomyces octosporus yFS286]|uniref:GTP cyclohydrolase II n=1 Tax=Schizosaccharomyces octosporus (strain yFS286) TaxID=483514 RepID=S9PST2_SCHOY|nr:GTP cyclohydrolase II [Schizosaccharomyces octosporus yFS286]EPX72201.1 GTP cyclohydrolase II [Schizosaccharomyces octosporus yFS286]
MLATEQPKPSSHEQTHPNVEVKKPLYTRPVVLTTYPTQNKSDPFPLNWGASSPQKRGPITVARSIETLPHRNAIGAHGGSYCVYNSLAVAGGFLPADHHPDFTLTEPTFDVPKVASWHDKNKIVAMDPYGHDTPRYFKEYLEKGYDIRPTIAITRANIRVTEIQRSVENGSLKVDGKIVLNKEGDIAVTKVAVEPVWYLPGVAERFDVDEITLRRALFEQMGGAYPELITRPDIKVFLPPIGGATAYIFGPPEYLSDPTKKLAVRVHDECNGSDVFQSDICTCRPYLVFGIEEAAKEAQNGGAGLVVYYRKEGRALGEVVKYLVYNKRKRTGDTADQYFRRTEELAGVRDMRFQALMPDILHWFGITKIDRMLSMSNMKYDAIVNSGIPILQRVTIPEELIPADSQVEIDAKIQSGYFSDQKKVTEEDLTCVHGRTW